MSARWFGYCGSGFVGGHDHDGADIADHANFSWVYAYAHHPPALIVDTIRRVQAHGLKVVLGIEDLIWWTEWNRPAEPALWWTLRRKDGEANWTALWTALVAGGVTGEILALYHMDEPFHRAPTRKAGMAADLRLVNAYLKTFTTIPIAVIHSWTEMLPGHAAEMPAPTDGWGYDIGAFNCYSDAALGQDAASYRAMFDRVDAVYAGKPLLFVPDGQMFPHDTEPAKLARVNAMWDFARTHPRVIAVCPFTWNSVPGHHRGTKDVPALLTRYREVGRAITGRG